MLEQLKIDLRKFASVERAKNLSRFFKTGPGQYGEGDKFLGIKVPESRSVATKYKKLSFNEISDLLHSPIHEERLVALLILIEQFQFASRQSDEKIRERIYGFYLENTKYINNWDLVDLSAHKIVGPYLEDKPKVRQLADLKKLARSNSLWERRIAVIATFHYIANGDPTLSIKIAEMLLKDDHDLIHKAVGWMLREIGKRCSEKVLTDFLDKHTTTMPRIMLRYAIERLPESKRKYYLKLT